MEKSNSQQLKEIWNDLSKEEQNDVHEYLEYLLRKEIKNEINNGLVNYLTNGEPLSLTPATYENEETKKQYEDFERNRYQYLKNKYEGKHNDTSE